MWGTEDWVFLRPSAWGQKAAKTKRKGRRSSTSSYSEATLEKTIIFSTKTTPQNDIFNLFQMCSNAQIRLIWPLTNPLVGLKLAVLPAPKAVMRKGFEHEVVPKLKPPNCRSLLRDLGIGNGWKDTKHLLKYFWDWEEVSELSPSFQGRAGAKFHNLYWQVHLTWCTCLLTRPLFFSELRTGIVSEASMWSMLMASRPSRSWGLNPTCTGRCLPAGNEFHRKCCSHRLSGSFFGWFLTEGLIPRFCRLLKFKFSNNSLVFWTFNADWSRFWSKASNSWDFV